MPDAIAQDIVSEITESQPEILTTGPSDLITEKLLKISPSRRIFVISNNNSALFKGDFFSIIMGNELAIRCLVAKTLDDRIAIKIMKIYSLAKWNTIRVGMDIMILKGDDSFYRIKQENPEEAQIIKDEDNLFDDSTFLEEDASLEEKSNRIIKPDNIAAFQYGTIETIDSNQEATTIEHFNGSWAYQLADNIWGEFQYGQSNYQGFPSEDLSTVLTSMTFRLKFTIEGPWYSYIKPYGGYQNVTAESTDAGFDDGIKSDAALAEEVARLDLANKSGVIFGVTILKRFVPGWFLRTDIGSDIINVGLSLEF